jgi:hypothetical protein
MQAIYGMDSRISIKAGVYLFSRGAMAECTDSFMHHRRLLNERPLARSKKSETGKEEKEKKQETPADMEKRRNSRSRFDEWRFTAAASWRDSGQIARLAWALKTAEEGDGVV